MYRKIMVNIVVGLLVFPLLLLGRKWEVLVSGIYRIEDTYYPDFISFVRVWLHDTAYPIPSMLFLIFILTPFQLIKDDHFNEGKRLSFWKKCLIFAVILTICMIFIGLLVNAMHPIWYKNLIYPAILISYSILFPAILYWTVDRYVEKNSTSTVSKDCSD